jgi:Uncharacterised nucleotidyltransferase
MIDVHHTILPLTARPRPDAGGMLGEAIPLPPAGGVRGGGEAIAEPATSPQNAHPAPTSIRAADASLAAPPAGGRGDLFTLSPSDMVCHCAAHLFADGDLAGGLRNLWDLHCLLPELLDDVMDGNEPPDPVWVWDEARTVLLRRAEHHQLRPAVERAMRLAEYLFGDSGRPLTITDRLFIRRLTARDHWGRPARKLTRLIFYIRSHWLRMPPLMLARHLFTKWRKAKDKK